MKKYLVRVLERYETYYQIEAESREQALATFGMEGQQVDSSYYDDVDDSAEVVEELPLQNNK